MFDHMWQQIDDGVEDVSKQQIDAYGMGKDEFDNKMQAIADTVVGRMLAAQARGGVGSSQDRKVEGILKTEWKAKRYKKYSERLTSKSNTQAEAQQLVRQWSAFFWWQPGSLALLDAFVAAIIIFKQRWPCGHGIRPRIMYGYEWQKGYNWEAKLAKRSRLVFRKASRVRVLDAAQSGQISPDISEPWLRDYRSLIITTLETKRRPCTSITHSGAWKERIA